MNCVCACCIALNLDFFNYCTSKCSNTSPPPKKTPKKNTPKGLYGGIIFSEVSQSCSTRHGQELPIIVLRIVTCGETVVLVFFREPAASRSDPGVWLQKRFFDRRGP